MTDRKLWTTDILVVGGGIAGVFAACEARKRGARVLLMDQATLGRSGCTAVASGVIEMPLPADDPDEWAKSEKSPLANHKLYRRNLDRYPYILNFLESAGARFIREDGEYLRLPSGRWAEPSNLLLEEGGPQLGIALRAAAIRAGVDVLNRVQLRGLLTSDGASPTKGRVVGAVGFGTRDAVAHVIRAKAVVVATGPFSIPHGRLNLGWATRYMPINASGDGHRAMWEAGATMGKLELGYQGPRAIGFTTAPAMEMLAGLGGHSVYVNRKGERFLSADFREKEWGRSSVFTAIMREVSQGRGPVAIDVSHFSNSDRRLLKQVVPIVMANFESAGIDLATDPVPYMVAPPIGVGSSGGGARVSEDGQTTVEGLFAAGNCSDGAYITLGQGLGICAITGLWAGESASKYTAPVAQHDPVRDHQVDQFVEEYQAPLTGPRQNGSAISATDIADVTTDVRLSLTPTMNEANLSSAIDTVTQLRDTAQVAVSAEDPHELSKVNALRSSLEVLIIALHVMRHRTESRGNLIRNDYTYTNNDDWLTHTIAENDGHGGVALKDLPIPREFWITPPAVGQTLHDYFRDVEVGAR